MARGQASALLDLVSEKWLHQFSRAVAAGALPLYATLSYDGRTDLSPATQVMLELRAAVKCEQKRLVLAKVRQLGDARILPLLYALQTRNGCSPFGLGDCWGCMRQSTDIEDTIKAVSSRSGIAPAVAAPPPAEGESERDSDD